jgi:xanthine/uracil permease
MILIAKEYGLQAVYGSMLIGGIVGLALAWPLARIIRFFPPLVTGAVLTAVGISLIGVAGGLIVGTDPSSPTFASPTNIALAVLVIVVAVASCASGVASGRSSGC